MRRALMVSIRMAVLTIVLTGVIYPLVVTGIAAVAFPGQAGGSLVKDRAGTKVGSSLIGQSFTSDRYFHARPSSAGAGYDAMASGPSNLGPTNRKLIDSVRSRAAETLRANPGVRAGGVPVDLVTGSASGLDPDVSPDSALLQVERVAGARALPVSRVLALVREHVGGRQLGILGEPRVNVLELNMALDALSSK